VAVSVDVTDTASVEAMTAQVLDSHGRIDILINSAGLSRNSVSWKLADVDWKARWHQPHRCIPVHAGRFTRNARARLGRIINISSIVGQIGVAGTSAYAATKAGLVGMTRSIASEVANKGITVNALHWDTLMPV